MLPEGFPASFCWFPPSCLLRSLAGQIQTIPNFKVCKVCKLCTSPGHQQGAPEVQWWSLWFLWLLIASVRVSGCSTDVICQQWRSPSVIWRISLISFWTGSSSCMSCYGRKDYQCRICWQWVFIKWLLVYRQLKHRGCVGGKQLNFSPRKENLWKDKINGCHWTCLTTNE